MATVKVHGIEYQMDDLKLEELTRAAKNGWGALDMKVSNESYDIVRIADTKIHNYVFKYTPPMTNDEFNDLIEDIAKHGQLEPIKIWRKRGTMFVVDGRNRINALTALGIKYVKYVEVKINTLDDLSVNILAWDKRRKTTKSQKAVMAYFDYKKNHRSEGGMGVFASKYGVAKAYISLCKTIDKARGGGSALLMELLEKRTVKLNGKNLKSLTAIIEEIKKMNAGDSDGAKNGVIPKPYREIAPVLNSLKNAGDLSTLGYIKKAITRMVNEVNNAED